MILEHLIYELLSTDDVINGLIGDRINPTIATDGTSTAYLTYSVTATETNATNNGVCDLERSTLEVATFSQTASEVFTVLSAVKTLLHGYRGGNIRFAQMIDHRSERQEDSQRYAGSQTYSLWWHDADVIALTVNEDAGAIITGADSVTLSACDNVLTLDCDGLTLNGEEVGGTPDLSDYARLSQPNEFTEPQTITTTGTVLQVPLSTTERKVEFYADENNHVAFYAQRLGGPQRPTGGIRATQGGNLNAQVQVGSGSVVCTGNLSADNLSGTNTGDQDLSDYARLSQVNTFEAVNIFEEEVVTETVTSQNGLPSAGQHGPDLTVKAADGGDGVGFEPAGNGGHLILKAGEAGTSGLGNGTQGAVKVQNNSSEDKITLDPVSGSIIMVGDLNAGGTVTGSNLSGTNTGDQDLSDYARLSQANTFTTGPQTIRQSGGTAGTDEIQISHNGSRALIESKDGYIELHSADQIAGRSFRITQRGGGGPAIDAVGANRLSVDGVLCASSSSLGWEVDGAGRLSTNSGAGFTLKSAMQTKTQITSDQNNYNTANARYMRISSDAARSITGFVQGEDGQECFVFNVGGFNITLKQQDTNSSENNRIASVTGADIVLAENEGAVMMYDATTLRWRTWEM